MEVHHHTHAHAKKNWKTSLWEFLMLFLAVTAGFLVENLREHYIELKREEVFIKSFVEDLKQDTANISANIQLRSSKILIMDSLIKLLNSSDPIQMVNRHIIGGAALRGQHFFNRMIVPSNN
jgi:hypothetical protein